MITIEVDIEDIELKKTRKGYVLTLRSDEPILTPSELYEKQLRDNKVYYTSIFQTVYEKINGEQFIKETGNYPMLHSRESLKPGDINSYQHKALTVCEQYFFDFQFYNFRK